jgi:MoaA/NifB/PqqE/SkfB family radical SAM enzyme
MEAGMFRKVVGAVAPLTDEVCFHLMGEPLLHPGFDEYVAVCEEAGVRVNLTTNGILLKSERVKALLNPAVKQVNFSLQSFESNFPDQDNSSYLQKIFEFTERALLERPDLYVNYRLWNFGAEGAEASNLLMIEKIKKGLQADFDEAVNIRWKKNVKIKSRVYLHFDSRFEWPNPHHPVRATQGFCHGLSSHIGILADGTVVPCCLDKEGVINLGNCGSQSIDDLIQSPRAQAIRDGFKNGILVEDLCQKCTFITRFDNKLKQLKKKEPSIA